MRPIRPIRLTPNTSLGVFCGRHHKYDIDVILHDPVRSQLFATDGTLAIVVPVDYADDPPTFPDFGQMKEFSPNWDPDVMFCLGVEQLRAMVDYAQQRGEETIQFGLQTDDSKPNGIDEDAGIAFAVGDARGVVLQRAASDNRLFETLLRGVNFSTPVEK